MDAPPNCIPYGLAVVAAVLRTHGFVVEIYDVNALRPRSDQIIAALGQNEWDLIGLSGLITTYGFQKWLIDELKIMNPDALVISGGGIATCSSEILFEHTNVDIAVVGEGEQTMLELCRVVERDVALRQVAGIWFPVTGFVVKN